MIIVTHLGLTWDIKCSGLVSQDKLFLRLRDMWMVVLPTFFFILTVTVAAAIYAVRADYIRFQKHFVY